MSRTKERNPLPKVSKESFKEALGIFEYLRPYKWHYIIGLILLSVSSVVFLGVIQAAGLMVDIATGENTDFTLNDIGIALIVVLLAQGVISYFRIVLFAYVSEKGIAAIRIALFNKLLVLPIPFFEKNQTGELISRLTGDVDRLYNAFSLIIAEFIRQLIMIIGSIVLIIYTAWNLGLFMLATFPVVVIGAYFFGKHIRKLTKQRQTILAETNLILSEASTNINIVKSYTSEVFESDRYGSSVNKYVDIAINVAKTRGVFAAFIVTVVSGAIFLIIWKAATLLQAGDMTAGQLINFVTYTSVVGISIAGLGNFYGELIAAIGATERIREILRMDGEIDIKPYEDVQIKFKGDVEFKSVDFTYPARADMQILHDFSMKIVPGEKIALVGASGAGKSTIMQLLLKFYDIEGGDILIDGKSYKDYELSDYRKNFALVPQEVQLFGGSIRENILYGRPNASDNDVIDAAKKSNSWEFISSFPEGLETIVGERGVKLSGGQRQRIAIARAILKDPAILLLDEATSALDAESEQVVQDALNELMKGRTSIIIAHRLATIREVDRIYVMDHGKVIEQGSHIELSNKDEGAYSNLAKLQFDIG